MGDQLPDIYMVCKPPWNDRPYVRIAELTPILKQWRAEDSKLVLHLAITTMF
jgi:hypothetical protein